ncbi:MAG: asparaginase [Armatimonadota bacterium]
MPLLAEVVRGSLVESRHCGDIVLMSADGRMAGVVGDPHRPTYLRSSAKPAQALALVESGAADRFGITDEEVAVVCGSHLGSDAHRAAVSSILAKAGLSEGDLKCGTHEPGNRAARDALVRRALKPSPLHNNCSGKHAGMLATCVHLQLPIESYLERHHPLQKRILNRIADLAAIAPGDIALAEDGCGVPTFGMPLSSAARLFATLASDDGPGPARIRRAMAAHPEMVRGPRDFNTELLRVLGERIIAKSGAEALFCCGLPALRLGVAIRIDDGNGRALPQVAVSVLQQLGVLSADDESALKFAASAPLHNCRGRVVGEVRAADFRLRAPCADSAARPGTRP